VVANRTYFPQDIYLLVIYYEQLSISGHYKIAEVLGGYELPLYLANDRLARIARIIAYAGEIFGEQEKVYAWLRRPNRTLENRLPLDLLETETGVCMVETILSHIEQGIYF
jgi:hypothetical protein